MPEHPSPAERRECARPELHIEGECLHCENARLAAAVRDLADENERLRADVHADECHILTLRAERDAARAENAALREALGDVCRQVSDPTLMMSDALDRIWRIARAALSNPQPQTAAEDQP